MDSTAVNELGDRVRDLMKVARLMKQHRPVDRAHGASSLVGALMLLESLPTGCHARDLADRAGLDQSTVSRTVAVLVSRGLVERRADPRDKRASYLAITPAGRDALTEAHDWYADVLSRALADWDPDEVAALNAGLARFVDGIERVLSHEKAQEAAR
jgi:DNA-binding MarR family transcriptional regulator